MRQGRATCPRVLLILMLLPAVPAAQAPTLEELLARTTTYITDWVVSLSNIVATEEYVQRVIGSNSSGFAGSRRLDSDFLLVRYPGTDSNWMAFRDVAVVDGIPVRHERDRLVKLFTHGDATAQASEIAEESQRYHIPGASFNMTNPLVAVALLQPYYRERLTLSLEADDGSAGRGVRVLKFQETEERTSVGVNGKLAKVRLPPLLVAGTRVRGTVSVDQSTGRIIRTEATVLGSASRTATSTTTFTFDTHLGLMVPAEMQTRWNYRGTVSGVATYTDFRRFDVHTETTTMPSNR